MTIIMTKSKLYRNIILVTTKRHIFYSDSAVYCDRHVIYIDVNKIVITFFNMYFVIIMR